MESDGSTGDKRRNRLGKGERLRHKRLVEDLFSRGKTLYDFPLRLTYRVLSRKELEESFRNGIPPLVSQVQMMVTVPKKKRRHAVDRVLLRRRIREAYRLNKGPLLDAVKETENTGTLSLAFVYMHAENLDYSLIERKMRKLLCKLLTRLKEEHAPQ